MLESHGSRETTTTSLRQGCFREEMSEGSQQQNCEPTNRNVIEGRDSWGELAPHNEALWFKGHGKWRGCAGTVHVLIRAGLSEGSQGIYGSRTEVHRERDGETTGPYGDSDSTTVGNSSRIGQKSAEVIVAAVAVKDRTVSHKEEP